MRLLTLLALALTAFKAWLTHAAGFDLHYDEAQYWEWSQQLDWSYYSKGPLLAWLIALSEALFGHGEWQVRLFGWLTHGALLALVFFFARDVWGNRSAAWWAVIITLFTPLYFTLGMVMSTDIFLFACWTGGLWAIYRALFKNQPRAWYAAGAAIGIGALTKLSIGLLPFFAGLLILLNPRLRHHLKNPHAWGGVGVLLAFMSPILFWNATHNWVMFRHELGHVQGGQSTQHFFDFFAGQILALSPLVALLAISVLWRRPAREDQRFLWWLALCWIGFFAFKALSAKVQINWPAPSYIGLLILFAGHLPAFSRLKRRVLYAGMGLATALMGIAYFPHNFGLGDPFKDTKAWQQPIAALAAQIPGDDYGFILTSSYALAGELAFYWPQRVPVYITGNAGRRFNQHDLWPGIDREAGRNGVFISASAQPPAELAQAFEHCSALAPIAARAADGRVLRTLYASICRHYRPIAWPLPGSY